MWAFFATFTNFFGGVFLAMLINNKKTKCQKLWRTLFIITIAVPQFVTLLLVRNFFSDAGIFNTMMANAGVTDFLKAIGLLGQNMNHIPFLTDQHWAKFMIILINIWVGVPYQMLIATGVLMNIPTDILEASTIDGASPLQSFIHIKLPYLLSVQGPALVTDFVRNVNNFNVIYLLTQDVYITKDQALASSSAKEVDLLVTWLFRLTQEQYNYKMAAVIGIMVFIICAVFTLVCFRFLNKKGGDVLLTQTTVSPARRAETAAQLRRGRILRTVRSILRHLLLALLAAIWLVTILWLLVTSFSTDRASCATVLPGQLHTAQLCQHSVPPGLCGAVPALVYQHPCGGLFQLRYLHLLCADGSYALSCCRFKGRKLIQNLSVSVNLFPGVLAMIAVYFVLKYLNLTNSYAGLIMVYAGSSGLGYLICKGFFDTIPISLREAAKLDGASDARVFFQVVLPMSKPILVYTIISSFMVPWTDFVMAKMILNSGVSADWTVAIGLYNMLQKT